MPGGFCAAGFSSLSTAFIICLLADIACQVSRLPLDVSRPTLMSEYRDRTEMFRDLAVYVLLDVALLETT